MALLAASHSLSSRVIPRVRSGPKSFWSPPSGIFFKLNFDGSRLSNGSSAFGFVLRNVNGDVLLAGAQALGFSVSILQAEASGLWVGLRGALSQGISNILIEGDNISVINAVTKAWPTPWEINNIICDVGKKLN